MTYRQITFEERYTLGLLRRQGLSSAKIDLLHALGILADDAHNDLHLIRKIRNEFAHVVHRHSFDDPEVRDRCRHLEVVKRWDSNLPNLSEPGEARKAFLFTVWALVGDVSKAMGKLE